MPRGVGVPCELGAQLRLLLGYSADAPVDLLPKQLGPSRRPGAEPHFGPCSLPGGALVGYITNWVAIKLIFDPVEPVQLGPFVFQGLFEKRQVEVSQEFSEFLADRVLTSQRLISEIANGSRRAKYEELVRRTVPPMAGLVFSALAWQVPDQVVQAAAGALRKAPLNEPALTPLPLCIVLYAVELAKRLWGSKVLFA